MRTIPNQESSQRDEVVEVFGQVSKIWAKVCTQFCKHGWKPLLREGHKLRTMVNIEVCKGNEVVQRLG